ncbi:hypothetical protein VTI74DRAFT_11075 [Chaetomium olivicolor]
MTKLSPCVFIHRPTAASPVPSSTDTALFEKPAPKLIVLASWMGARDPHIAKYLLQYQAQYPASPILLLRAEPRHFLQPRGALREFAPAAPVVRSLFPGLDATTITTTTTAKSERKQPQLLIHSWSNGGAASLHNLRLALGNPPFPPYTLVLDSAPGNFHYGSAVLAFTAGIEPPLLWLISPFMRMICLWYWFMHMLIGRGKTGPIVTLRAALNDEMARQGEVRRTYVYGTRDRLVFVRDVEAHAEDAERKGFREVRREKFEGGEHVALVRGAEAARYWRIVKETWEGVD